MNTLDWLEDSDLKALLHIMLDIEALATGMQPLSNGQLKEILNISLHRLNKYLDILEKTEMVEVVRRRPKTYQIKENFLQEIFD